MATCSSVLAWETTWAEKPGGLQSMGSQRVRHNLVTEHARSEKEYLFCFLLLLILCLCVCVCVCVCVFVFCQKNSWEGKNGS